ncbi:MAG: hypothetical protein JXB03_06775 [Spirochaetales bacterium]|nr:hypothetical protein [Spirochaetales bacterium]
MKPFFFVILLCLLLCINCVSKDPEPADEVTQGVYDTWTSRRVYYFEHAPWQEHIQPVEGLHDIEGFPDWVWNNIPAGDIPLFLGIAYPYVDEEKERQAALEYAAMQAVRYNKIIGLAHSVTVRRGSSHYYSQEVIARYDEDEVPVMAEELIVLAESRNEKGTFLLTCHPQLKISPSFVKVPEGYRFRIEDTLPDVPGFKLAAGGSRKYVRISDSLIAADKNAFAELLKQQHVHIVNQQDLESIVDSGDIFSDDTYEYSTGILRGFYIIARWTDGEYFYSVAIAPE